MRPLWRLDPNRGPPSAVAERYKRQYLSEHGPDDGANAACAEAYVAALTGDVFWEDLAFTVTTGKRLFVQPFEFAQLAREGLWDKRPLLEDVRRHRFVAVIHGERIDGQLLEAVSANYVTAAEFGDYFIYRPAT